MTIVQYDPDKKTAFIRTTNDTNYYFQINKVESFRTCENDDGTFQFILVGTAGGSKATIKGKADVILTWGVDE